MSSRPHPPPPVFSCKFKEPTWALPNLLVRFLLFSSAWIPTLDPASLPLLCPPGLSSHRPDTGKQAGRSQALPPRPPRTVCSVPIHVLLPKPSDACSKPHACRMDTALFSFLKPVTRNKAPETTFSVQGIPARARVRAKCDSPRDRYHLEVCEGCPVQGRGELSHLCHAGSSDPGSC